MGLTLAPNGRPRFVYQSISGDSAHPISVLHQYEHALTNVTSQEELDPSLCSGFMCGLRDPASIIVSYMQNKLLERDGKTLWLALVSSHSAVVNRKTMNPASE